MELTNGGTNVNKNESFNTTMQGKTYRIKVEKLLLFTPINLKTLLPIQRQQTPLVVL